MKVFLMYFRIALRNVSRNPRRSLITIIAISFSLLCLVVFGALKQGLHNEMVSNTIRIDSGSLQIHSVGYEPNLAYMKPVTEKEKVIEELRKAGAVDFTYRIKTAALILAGKKSSTVILSGVSPASETAITLISSNIVRGEYLINNGDILIGEELANSLKVKIGKKIALMVQGSSGSPLLRKFIVGGTYRTGLASFDRTHVYLNLNTARSFLEVGDIVTEIVVRADLDQLYNLAARLKRELPDNKYQVKTWEQIAPDVKQLIELNNATMNILMLIVFAIVAMGIINTMTTATFERFRELGTLSAIGTPPRGIICMIVLESFLLGVISMFAGSLAGVISCSYLAEYGIDLTQLTSSNQYFASNHVLKAHLNIKNLIGANFVTLLTAVMAGIYPACKAALLDPVKAILHI